MGTHDDVALGGMSETNKTWLLDTIMWTLRTQGPLNTSMLVHYLLKDKECPDIFKNADTATTSWRFQAVKAACRALGAEEVWNL